MDSLRRARSRFGRRVTRAWDGLADGWRQLFGGSGDALTHFASGCGEAPRGSPSWGLLAGEAWETEQCVIVRLEIPGLRKDDIVVSVHADLLRVHGVKRSEAAQTGRKYHVTQRAFGSFERAVRLPTPVVAQSAEVSCRDGVVTIILNKAEPGPPLPVARG